MTVHRHQSWILWCYRQWILSRVEWNVQGHKNPAPITSEISKEICFSTGLMTFATCTEQLKVTHKHLMVNWIAFGWWDKFASPSKNSDCDAVRIGWKRQPQKEFSLGNDFVFVFFWCFQSIIWWTCDYQFVLVYENFHEKFSSTYRSFRSMSWRNSRG